jgi:hypothetical protein
MASGGEEGAQSEMNQSTPREKKPPSAPSEWKQRLHGSIPADNDSREWLEPVPAARKF